MNIIAANQNLTMSSREIATLLNKNHSDIKRSAKRLSDAGVLTKPLAESEFEHRGNIYSEYLLEKRDCFVLVAQNSPEFTAVIVDRWQELESGAEKNLPQTKREWIEFALEQEKKLELAAPKVAFVDNFVETGTTKTLRETAKILNYPERKMIALMIDHDILYRMSGKLLPYQKYHEQKLFEVKTGERNGHAFTQTRVTTKGLTWLGERYASDLMEDK
ncbi:antirepressor protein [Vibrio phage 1.036.O._10N.286.45.C3]|nr:antirepressor protein [Vibrio phage 1.036.O._10N.286.45.C3]AUR86963.1 antirepressor protein [Vibrio phage 1.091.O._10N.286.52.B12]